MDTAERTDHSLPPYLSPLPAGVDPLPPELIASHRREQILTSAVEVFTTRGYRATKTDHLAAASPTALATFYTLFKDKEDCFLQAYDRILAESREQLEAEVDTGLSWPEQLRSALRALLAMIAAEPQRARLLLVEAQAAGEAAQVRHEANLSAVALFLRRGRSANPLANQRPDTFEPAIAAGLSWLLHRRLTTGEVEGIEALLPELERFVLEPYFAGRLNHRLEEPPGDSHANGASSDRLRPAPEQQPPGEEPVRGLPRLPPGRHGLPRSFIIQNQRDRLSAGIIAVVAEHGYHDATVARIAKAAGVSRRTFYTCFSSKQDCFLATYDLLAEHLVEAMGAAAQGVGDDGWPELLRARLDALLWTLAANPDLVPFLIAPLGARGKLAARYRDFLDALLAILAESGPPITDRPCEAIEQSLIGGLIGLIARQVRAGEGERLPELAGDLFEFFLVSYLGPDALASPLAPLEAPSPLAVLAGGRSA
jgi:AcrR family transcriptional regulator